MPFTCPVCGNEEYDEDDGRFYCTECNTQSQEYVVQEADPTGGDLGNMRHEVASAKAKRRWKEKASLGRPWTIYEAYQFIILAQADALTALGASKNLKDVVFTIWANYLSKLGVAFSLKECIVPDIVEQLQTGRPRELCRGTLSKPSTGNKRLVAQSRKCKYLEDDSGDEDPTWGEEGKLAKISSTKAFIDERQLMKSKNEYYSIRFSAQRSAQWMDIKKTIALCFIGVTLTNPDILPSDVVRWIYEGKIPFLSTSHLLPDDMMLSSYDYCLFHVSRFDTDVLVKEVNKLNSFLGTRDLPQPNLNALAGRFLKELCLPKEFSLFVQRLIQRIPFEWCTSKHIYKRSDELCFAYIVLAFKVIFGLDDASDVKLSKYSQELQELLELEPKLFSFTEWKSFMIQKENQTFDAYTELTSNISLSKPERLEDVVHCYSSSSQDKRRLAVRRLWSDNRRPVKHFDPEFREALAKPLTAALGRSGHTNKDKDEEEKSWLSTTGETFRDSTVSHLVDLPAFTERVGTLTLKEKTKCKYEKLLDKISSFKPQLVMYPFPTYEMEVSGGRHSNYLWLLGVAKQVYHCDVLALDKTVVRLTEYLAALSDGENLEGVPCTRTRLGKKEPPTPGLLDDLDFFSEF